MLTSISLSGYKSIGSIENLALGPVNVLIGANGVGKSNLLSAFRMLSFMLTGDGMQYYVRQQGGANKMLHDGSDHTTSMEMSLTFDTISGKIEYAFKLNYGSGDNLFFAEEQYRYSPDGLEDAQWKSLGNSHIEPMLIVESDSDKKTREHIEDAERNVVTSEASIVHGNAIRSTTYRSSAEVVGSLAYSINFFTASFLAAGAGALPTSRFPSIVALIASWVAATGIAARSSAASHFAIAVSQHAANTTPRSSVAEGVCVLVMLMCPVRTNGGLVATLFQHQRVKRPPLLRCQPRPVEDH